MTTANAHVCTVEDREEDKSCGYSPEFTLIGHEGTESEIRVQGRVFKQNNGLWSWSLEYRYSDEDRRKKYGSPHHRFLGCNAQSERKAQLNAVARAMGACNGGFPLDWDVR